MYAVINGYRSERGDIIKSDAEVFLKYEVAYNMAISDIADDIETYLTPLSKAEEVVDTPE